MSRKTKIYVLGDLAVIYYTLNDITSLLIVPADMQEQISDDKLSFKFDRHIAHKMLSPMVQVAVCGDDAPHALTAGHSLRNFSSALALKFKEQKVQKKSGVTTIITNFTSEGKLIAEHRLIYDIKYKALEMSCSVSNISNGDILLEALPSFEISMLSPFCLFNSTPDILLHRVIAHWSAEGQLLSQRFCDLGLEDSWAALGVRTVRWGQAGSFPVRGYMSVGAVEDKKAGVVWAAQLAESGSWVMEVSAENGYASLTGGHADYLFGHWRKKLKQGECYSTSSAAVTAVRGTLDEACSRLVAYQDRYSVPLHPDEKGLPPMYNEYCYTWGNPSKERLLPQLELAKQIGGLKYFMVDAGWYGDGDKNWQTVGDWHVNNSKFPDGLKDFSDIVTKAGMRTGIWFEFENVHAESNAYHKRKKWFLTRNGIPIRYGDRYFLDFRKKEVRDALKNEIIPIIVNNGIGYVKLDYNAPIGIGPDGAESEGEALRQHLEAAQDFYRDLKKTLPHVVMEICASGGSRAEPSWMAIGDMVSFSDAHCTRDESVIAANLHRVCPPKKLQIWSTIEKGYNEAELVFTVVKSFFGRMCLSGDLSSLSIKLFEKLKEGVRFYQKITSILERGTSYLIQNTFDGMLDIKGVQKFLRVSEDDNSALVIINIFQGGGKREEWLAHQKINGMKIDNVYAETGAKAEMDADGKLRYISTGAEYCACAVLLKKE